MYMAKSGYHKLLRVSILLVALLLVFDSGLVMPITEELSDGTINYVANSIGIFAGVPENELNVITAELTARERELDGREAELAEREIASRDFGNERDLSVYVLSIILFILTVLIVLNYAMDWIRVRNLYHERKAH
jgi:hypothetical protein